MAEYQILTQVGEGEDRQEPGTYATAKPTAKSAHAFQKLRLRNKGLDMATRYRIAKSEGFDKWIVEEDDNDPLGPGGTVAPPENETELSEHEYIERAAQVLFPAAPVAGNTDYIDRSKFWEAESDFLSLIERPSKGSSGSSLDLNSLALLSQMVKKQNTKSTEKE